jgi:hypothetical protein
MPAIHGDEDVKIADGHFSPPRSEDTAERAAREYLEQKSVGNIERARELGSLFARAVLDDSGLLAEELKQKSMLVRHHIYLLYTYIANRVIAEYAPSPILAQTSLNRFYKDIETASEDLYRHVNDMAAFSLYILCERSKNRTDNEIGLIFAELCGLREDAAMIEYGNRLFRTFYNACAEQIKTISYKAAE